MNKRNFDREMEQIARNCEAAGKIPRVLLHSCCGPCSSACIERLTEHFEVTVFYYNPNIYPESEYAHRVQEQQRLIGEMPHHYPVHFIEGHYDPQEFYEMARGYEKEPEGGERCFRCYEQRLRRAAEMAKAGDYDYFTTTLTVSPLKNSQKLNEIGERLAEELDMPFLVSDFKKKNGYARSVELSALYHMYRQNYCGCVFSLRHDLSCRKSPTVTDCQNPLQEGSGESAAVHM